MTRTRLDPRNPLSRVSAWLADIDDWDADDADVFVAALEPAEPEPRPVTSVAS